MPGWLSYLFGGIAGVLLTIFGILYFVIKHYETFEKLISSISKAFRWLGASARRNYISKDLQGYINSFTKETENNAFGSKILPFGIKIQWLKEEKKEIKVEEGDVIIRLGYDLDQNRNFVEALMLYMSEAFLPNSKMYMDENLFEACKFIVSKKIAVAKSAETCRYFINNCFRPAIKANENILEYCDRLAPIDNKGLLTSIFLRELAELGDRLVGSLPKKDTYDEVKSFLNFIYNIAEKDKYKDDTGIEPQLLFISNYLRVGVVLVAKAEIRSVHGFTPHLSRAKKNFADGAQITYIAGSGGENIDGVKWVAAKLKEEGYPQIGNAVQFTIEIYDDRKDEIRKTKCICFAFRKKD